MKILSKRNEKDYYDYLVGVYGEDNKLILDRRDSFHLPYTPSDSTKFVFHICGKEIECLYHKGEFLYGDSIKEYCKEIKFYGQHKWRFDNWTSFHLEDRGSRINSKLDCPIVVESIWGVTTFCNYPILKDFNFHKVMDSHTIWIKLSEWLGKEKLVLNNQSNQEKIVSHGFDTKTSFRNV